MGYWSSKTLMAGCAGGGGEGTLWSDSGSGLFGGTGNDGEEG